jgi:hypothetical protein
MGVDACVGHKLRQEEMYKQPNIVWVEVSMALGSTRMLQCSCIWVVYSAIIYRWGKASFGWNYKPAEKHCWLIFVREKYCSG